MDYRVLGPLMVGADAAHHLTGPRERKILATLVLSANQPVSAQRLIDVIWPQSPPPTVRQQVQNCVGTLRNRLRAAGLRPRIARSADTYLLEIAEDQADVLVFERLCRDADELVASGQTAAACRILKRALGLWRGRACEDIGADHLAGRTAALEERRLRAIERYVHATFARGAGADVLEELSSWVHHYPYHEGLHADLAEALQRAGRTAEALRVVRDLKRRLRDELAINASPAIEDIERRLLADRNACVADQDPLRSIQVALAQLSAAVDLMATSG